MNKSIFERIFPRAPGTSLPQHEYSRSSSILGASHSRTSTPHSDTNRNLYEDVTREGNESRGSSRRRSNGSHSSMGAPLVHHDDPFLPIERAAKALEHNIQSFLDAHFQNLGAVSNGRRPDNPSITPTHSTAKSLHHVSGRRTVPVRQPQVMEITLKGARMGLSDSMKEFELLRENEMHLLDTELRTREEALERVDGFETRRDALSTQMRSVQDRGNESSARDLRQEAGKVQTEISELEHRILELKVKKRHLLNQASQIESSLESELSSFKASLELVEGEIAAFLRRPPIPSSLARHMQHNVVDIYTLKADRRTLAMAKEQWQDEAEAISKRKAEVHNECQALVNGGKMWSEAVRRITKFEQTLRRQTKHMSNSRLISTERSQNISSSSPPTDAQGAMSVVSADLNDLIDSLQADIDKAGADNWNILVAALGAELSTLHQALALLAQTSHSDHDVAEHSKSPALVDVSVRTPDTPGPTKPVDLTGTEPLGSPTLSERSNQSLKDTLAEFGHSNRPSSSAKSPLAGQEERDDSNDDEPPLDFL